MEAVLERNGGYVMSAAGMSIEKYNGIARWLVEGSRPRVSYLPESVTAWLRTLYAVRAENIQSAMKDAYNWQMLLKPTELVDLDSLILMYLALGNDDLEGELDELLAEQSRLCQAPLIIARALWHDRRMLMG